MDKGLSSVHKDTGLIPKTEEKDRKKEKGFLNVVYKSFLLKQEKKKEHFPIMLAFIDIFSQQ